MSPGIWSLWIDGRQMQGDRKNLPRSGWLQILWLLYLDRACLSRRRRCLGLQIRRRAHVFCRHARDLPSFLCGGIDKEIFAESCRFSLLSYRKIPCLRYDTLWAAAARFWVPSLNPYVQRTTDDAAAGESWRGHLWPRLQTAFSAMGKRLREHSPRCVHS